MRFLETEPLSTFLPAFRARQKGPPKESCTLKHTPKDKLPELSFLHPVINSPLSRCRQVTSVFRQHRAEHRPYSVSNEKTTYQQCETF
jgi:hypothetical protein